MSSECSNCSYEKPKKKKKANVCICNKGDESCAKSKTKFCDCFCQVCERSEFYCLNRKSDELIKKAANKFIQTLLDIDEKYREGFGDTAPREVLCQYIEERICEEL
jgi:hypothetical protein